MSLNKKNYDKTITLPYAVKSGNCYRKDRRINTTAEICEAQQQSEISSPVMCSNSKTRALSSYLTPNTLQRGIVERTNEKEGMDFDLYEPNLRQTSNLMETVKDDLDFQMLIESLSGSMQGDENKIQVEVDVYNPNLSRTSIFMDTIEDDKDFSLVLDWLSSIHSEEMMQV